MEMEPGVGLCSVCVHARRTGNRRGSVFYLCRRAAWDPRLRRYPPLPMRRCPGFEAGSSRDPEESDGAGGG